VLDQRPDAVAAYVVTPSYFGAAADVRALADVAHARDALLVVDEAWGAHFGFHPDLPANALSQGADVVISSTPKLGGSLTQLGCCTSGVARSSSAWSRFRSMQSTSASSVLTMSVDIARSGLAVHVASASAARWKWPPGCATGCGPADASASYLTASSLLPA
jgi:lysine decarboxylase